MDLFKAIILGVVQGLTEWLPISSTAHLKIVPALLGWKNEDGTPFEPGAAFSAVIQWGTLLAALIYFRRDIWRIVASVLLGVVHRKPLGTPEARLGWMIVVGTVPVVACGVMLHSLIEREFRSLYVISGAMIGLALVLAAAELFTRWRHKKGLPDYTVEDMGWARAIWIGIAQTVALIPGSSRSGVTITAGLFAGLRRAEAARFSFLLSLPSVFGAGLYELYKKREELLGSHESVTNLVVATVVSGVVGYASIWFLMTYLKTRTMFVFVAYRILLGGALLVLLGMGWLTP